MKAGFAEFDITPPVGTDTIGWIKLIPSTEVLDPLYGRIAVFESPEGRAARDRVAFIQLDVLCVDEVDVPIIRERIHDKYAFPGKNIMISATHNHAGPAVKKSGITPKDEEWTAEMIDRIVNGFGDALKNSQECEIGFNSIFEWRVAHNRRVVMRDGTVKTHGHFNDPDALCYEGPVDPEVAIIAARGADGELLGGIVNFSCHPTHHGGTGKLSGGFPAYTAQQMKERGCPVLLYLNGTCGNTHTANPAAGGGMPSMEEIGTIMADDIEAALRDMIFDDDIELGCASTEIDLPYREVDDDERKGTNFGAQRFVDPTLYDKFMPELVEQTRRDKTERIELQALFLGNHVVVGVPAEYFVEYGLWIKRETHPYQTVIAGYTNGSIGYIPTMQAFDGGGYETTFGSGSKFAHEAGDIIADAVVELVNEGRGE
jgi:neutral ceramidase